jgi:hypothetical protein
MDLGPNRVDSSLGFVPSFAVLGKLLDLSVPLILISEEIKN